MKRLSILFTLAAFAVLPALAAAQIVDGAFTGLYTGGFEPDGGAPAGAWEICPSYGGGQETTPYVSYIDYWPGTTDNPALWFYGNTAVVQQVLGAPLTGVYSIEFDVVTDSSALAGPEYYGMVGDFAHRVEGFGLRTNAAGVQIIQAWSDVTTAGLSNATWIPGEEMHFKIVTDLNAQTYDVYATSNGDYKQWIQYLDNVKFRHSKLGPFDAVNTISFASFSGDANGAIDNVTLGSPFPDVAPGVMHADNFDTAALGDAHGTRQLRQFEGLSGDFQIVADPTGTGKCVSLAATETIPEEGDPTYRGSAAIDLDAVVPETTAAEGAKMKFDLYLEPAAPPALCQAAVGGKAGSWSTVKATFGVDGNRIWMADGRDSGGGAWYYSANTLNTGAWYTFETDMALGGDGANYWNLKVTERSSGTVVLDSMNDGFELTFRDYSCEILQTQFFNGYGPGTILVDNYQFEVAADAPSGVGPVAGLPSYGIDFDSGYTPGNLTHELQIRVGQDGWRLREGLAENVQIIADPGGDGQVLTMTGTAANARQAVNRSLPKVEVTDTTKVTFDVMWQGTGTPTQFLQIGLGTSGLATSYDFMSMEFGINGDKFFIGDGQDQHRSVNRFLSDYSIVSDTWYTVEALIHMQGEQDNTYSFVITDRATGTVVWDTAAAGYTGTFREYDLENNTAMVLFYNTSDPNVLHFDNFLMEAIYDVQPLEGDLNGDGSVGSADLDLVRGNWGRGDATGPLDGDATGDGQVGSADLDVVRANWGQTQAAAVPEPAFFVFFLGAALFAVMRRRA